MAIRSPLSCGHAPDGADTSSDPPLAGHLLLKEKAAALPPPVNYVNTVIFSTECGQISLVESIVSKDKIDFSLGGILYEHFANQRSAQGLWLR